MQTHRNLLGFLIVSLFALGCSKGVALVPVTGKVTLNGKPINNVKVEFHPDPDKGVSGPSSYGTTDANGNFTLQSGSQGNPPGAVVGMHRVVMNDLDIYGNTFVGRGDYRNEDPKGPKEVPKIPRFKADYSDLSKTPFRQEVKAGMESLTFDIKK